MKRKKVLATILTVATVLSMLSGCGSEKTSNGDATSNETAAGNVDSIVFAVPLIKTVDMTKIEEAMNEITEEKINVHVEIEGIAASNYMNQIGLMQSGGEQLDCMGYMGTYSYWLSNNQLMCMDEYLDEYGEGTKQAIGEEFLKSTSKEGSVYALPTLNGKASVMSLVLRKDIVEELALPVDQLIQAKNFDEYCQNLDLISEMFEDIYAAHPDMTCAAPSSKSLVFTDYMPFTDLLNDSYGVVMDGDGKTVSNLYATEEYKKLLDYAYAWNQSGYILEDATTTQESANTYMQNGRAAGFFIKGEEGQAEQITNATGVDVESYKLAEGFIATSDVNQNGFAISATSKNPEAAMKFLDLMYTDEDVVNLLDWGVEGEDYEVQDDGTIDYPEGVTAETSEYGLNMDWFFGNQFLSKIWGKGRDTTIYERLSENNKNARISELMGFSFDSTKVSSEMTALQNVKDEYLPGLVCGKLNPDTDLSKFLDALDAAGLPNVINEKQTQIDAWDAAQ